jgi:hypothetical protein
VCFARGKRCGDVCVMCVSRLRFHRAAAAAAAAAALQQSPMGGMWIGRSKLQTWNPRVHERSQKHQINPSSPPRGQQREIKLYSTAWPSCCSGPYQLLQERPNRGATRANFRLQTWNYCCIPKQNHKTSNNCSEYPWRMSETRCHPRAQAVEAFTHSMEAGSRTHAQKCKRLVVQSSRSGCLGQKARAST